VPVCIAWFGESICVGYQRKAYYLVNSVSGVAVELDLPAVQPNIPPFVKVIDEYFYCLWGSNLLIPFEAYDGGKALKSPISTTESGRLIGISYNYPYIVIMMDTGLEIYNVDDTNHIQTENYVHGSSGVSISSQVQPIVYATTFSIHALRPIPVSEQIKHLLQECKIAEA
jgi:hypothetical protein